MMRLAGIFLPIGLFEISLICQSLVFVDTDLQTSLIGGTNVSHKAIFRVRPFPEHPVMLSDDWDYNFD